VITRDDALDLMANATPCHRRTSPRLDDRNVTRATPIDTYGADEIMQILTVSTATCTVKRDYAAQNSGTGSAVHATGDVFEVIATPKEEGSSPGANKYRDVTLTSNYTQNFDFEIEVTGDQLASERMVVADTVQAQVSMGMQKLSNELESTLLYGALIEAYTYQKGEADMLQLYTTRYNQAMLQLFGVDLRSKRDDYRDGTMQSLGGAG